MDTGQTVLNIDKIVMVNGSRYYSIKTFALLTGRTKESVRRLALYGNRLGKLKTIRVARSVLVLATELTDFKFCLAGTGREFIMYNKKGEERTEYEV